MRYLKYATTIFLCFLLCAIVTIPVYAANTRRYSYHYDFWYLDIDAVPFAKLTRTIDATNSIVGVPLLGLDDVHTSSDHIFLVDTQDSRVNVVDENFELVISIRLLRDKDGRIVLTEDGEQVMLNNPEGVFFHERFNELFIADTGARRILVLDGDDFHLKRIITEPENMTGVTEFRPSKIVVDNAGRIYTVVQGSFEGIVELTRDGYFARFFGVGRPIVNLTDFFWRMFATNEQRAVMARTYAPSFNNVSIDSDGFVFATTHDASSVYMLYRLNPRGENVLLAPYDLYIWGDGYIMGNRVSNFVAVDVTDFGVYAVLDNNRNRIFIYSFEGNLMAVINNPSGMRGGFRNPTGIAWFGEKLIVTDRDLRTAFVFEMTEFGALALNAQRDFFHGNWEASARQFAEIITLNTNYFLAYSGIGRFYLMEGNYERAMYYLRLGQDRAGYSQAFGRWRSLWIQRNFWWMALLFLTMAVTIIYSEIRYHKKSEG